MDDRSENGEGSGETQNEGSTNIHVTALDGLVNVNSLFTLAVFVGLSASKPSEENLVEDASCVAGEDIARNLLIFQVISFGSFLFSSLVAQGLKQAIVLKSSSKLQVQVLRAHINVNFLRFGMLLSALGSVCGSIFLMLALMDVAQIKLGTLSCGSIWPIRAVIPLFLLVPAAVLIYICVVLYAFLH